MTPAELRRRRTALRLSQYRLGRILGLAVNHERHTCTTVYRWESARSPIPAYVPMWLADLERQSTAPTG